tara:strand:+ start:6605 stop:6922 length:318 start_codon:yes stop_codon:yes gene_type:complete
MSDVIFDKAWLVGCVLIVVGIAGIYALIKYPKQFLTTALIGFAGLTALVLILAGMQEWKYMKIRENGWINESIETGKLANYLSNNPEYMRDEFITQWLHDWQYSY